MVQPDRAVRAGHFVAQVHPATERPADLELPDRAGLEADERDGVVLVGDRVDERVGVAHDLDRPVPLADEVADDLDAVAAEVDDRAAAGQPPVPEPRRVRPRMRLSRTDPGHVADRPVRRRLDRLERLRRVAQVLEVAAEDAGRLDDVEHPLRLLGRPAERLRAQDGLAGLRGQPDGLLVQEVGERDDHHVRVRMVDRGGQVGRRLGDRPALAERRPAPLAARVHDRHAIAAALAVQGHRVEVGDEPGTEHRDPVAVQCCPSALSVRHVGLAAIGIDGANGNANARAGFATNSRWRTAWSMPASASSCVNPSSSQVRPGSPPWTR